MPATHLTASMRAIRAHAKQRHISVDSARDEIKRLALRVASGGVTREDERLAAALIKATGCTVAELAVLTEDWPA